MKIKYEKLHRDVDGYIKLNREIIKKNDLLEESNEELSKVLYNKLKVFTDMIKSSREYINSDKKGSLKCNVFLLELIINFDKLDIILNKVTESIYLVKDGKDTGYESLLSLDKGIKIIIIESIEECSGKIKKELNGALKEHINCMNNIYEISNRIESNLTKVIEYIRDNFYDKLDDKIVHINNYMIIDIDNRTLSFEITKNNTVMIFDGKEIDTSVDSSYILSVDDTLEIYTLEEETL